MASKLSYGLFIGHTNIFYILESGYGDENVEYEELKWKPWKSKPIPSKKFRTTAASHMPEYTAKQLRCKRSGCRKKTTVFCKKCDISLCFTSTRNCFTEFHQDE